MTDWLGMLAAPRETRRPDLKGRVLAPRAGAAPKVGGPSRLRPLITLAVGGGGGAWWPTAPSTRSPPSARCSPPESRRSRTPWRPSFTDPRRGSSSPGLDRRAGRVGDDLRRQAHGTLAGALRRARPERARSGVPAVVHHRAGHVHGGGDAHGRGPADVMALEMPPGGVLGCGDEHRAAGRVGEPERPDGVPPAALVGAQHDCALLSCEVVHRLELQDLEPPPSYRERDRHRLAHLRTSSDLPKGRRHRDPSSSGSSSPSTNSPSVNAYVSFFSCPGLDVTRDRIRRGRAGCRIPARSRVWRAAAEMGKPRRHELLPLERRLVLRVLPRSPCARAPLDLTREHEVISWFQASTSACSFYLSSSIMEERGN